MVNITMMYKKCSAKNETIAKRRIVKVCFSEITGKMEEREREKGRENGKSEREWL